MLRLLGLLWCAAGVAAAAQPIRRGPYLQAPSHNAITILWRTAMAGTTRLWLGLHPDSLTLHTGLGSIVSNEHRVRLTGLEPGTTYYYAVGNHQGMLAGGDAAHRFRTFPPAGSTDTVRVWALGDFGKGNPQQVAVKQAFEAHPDAHRTDAWIWLGDNVYNEGLLSEYDEKVFALEGFSDIFSWLPFFPAPGNHDYVEVWRRSALLGIPYSNIPLEDHEGPYYDLFEMPEQGECGGFPSGHELFYAFDLGDAHFVSLNSEVYDLLGTSDGIDAMVEWLQQDLAANTRRFTIAYLHQPPYSKGSHDSDDWAERVMIAMRERVIPVLESFDADLVLSGHSHVYERSHLIHGHYGPSSTFDPGSMLRDGSGGYPLSPYVKDTLAGTPDGTVYVVCGNGGASEGGASLDHPVMAAADGGSGVCGSFLIEVVGDRLTGTYLKADGSVGDRFALRKGQPAVAMVEAGAPQAVRAYPNPAKDVLHVTYAGAGPSVRYRLLDVTGRAVRSGPVTAPRITFSILDLAPGAYELVVEESTRRAVQRIVVER